MSAPRRSALSETWWGSRWIQTLRRFGRDWSRGLTNARSATADIQDLDIAPGNIDAVVPGENGTTHQLRIRLRTLDQATWRRVLRRLAGKARYAARLLSGEMPRDIERVFAQSRASLFPRRRREIEYSCSCDDKYSPCSHVAAAQFVLAEAFDRDPFLLFELRGRSRDQVLAELREIRGSAAGNDRGSAESFADEEVWAQPRPEDYTVAGEDLETLGFHIAAADVPVGAIRALGPPRSWAQPLAVLKAFVPLYRAASAAALEIAWGGEEEVPASARLPQPETEQALVAMAEAMAKATQPDQDEKPSRSRGKRGGRRRRGRRRKGGAGNATHAANQGGGGAGPANQKPGKKKRRRRGRGRGAAAAGGGGGNGVAGGGAGGGAGGQPAPAGQKKRRRRRRGRGGGASGGGSGGGGGNSQPAPAQAGQKKRRRRRRGGGGGGGSGVGQGGPANP